LFWLRLVRPATNIKTCSLEDHILALGSGGFGGEYGQIVVGVAGVIGDMVEMA
jgi:hypothetical protein